MIAFVFGLVLGSAPAGAGPVAVEIPEVSRLFRDRADLPGRGFVFDEYLRRFGLSHSLHPPVTAMMDQIYDFMFEVEGERRLALDQACDAMLNDPTEQTHYAHNLATAQYLLDTGHDVRAQMGPNGDEPISIHQTLILPTGNPRRWLTRLAILLKQPPHPIELIVSTATISKTLRSLELHVEQSQLLISSFNVLPHHATLSIEHELFHIFQMRGHAERSDEVWPNHFVMSSRPELFEDRAREYVSVNGYFAIEEVGASTRDAVQTTLAIAADELHRIADVIPTVPADLIEVERRGALSFVAPALDLYQIALHRIADHVLTERELVRRDDLHAVEVPVVAGASLILPRNPNGPDSIEHVRRELIRGQLWLERYREFLTPIDAGA